MKTPQVTPSWNTGIYVGNGVVANSSEQPAQKYPSLIDRVLDQIREDVDTGDFTAIEEMLNNLPTEILVGYLPERD